MELIAYRYDCWPQQLEKTNFNDLDSKIEEDTTRNFKIRLNILNSLLISKEDVHYELGGWKPLFKHENDIVLRSYKRYKAVVDEELEEKYSEAIKNGNLKEAEELKKIKQPDNYTKIPSSRSDDTVPARIIYSNDGVYVIRIQKKRPLEGEDKNYCSVIYNENYVSSLVVLIIKDGRQFLFIENTRRTYAPSTIARIFECTLNRLLMGKYHMMVTVNAVRKLSDFWNTLSGMQNEGRSIKKLKFKFDYPNLPWPDDLLGGRFKRLGKDLNAEAEVIFKGQHGQNLNLKTKEGERNEDINSMAKYTCDKGNMAYAYYDNNTCTTFGSQQFGLVYVNLSDTLGSFQNYQAPQIFPSEYSNEILEQANAVKRINE